MIGGDAGGAFSIDFIVGYGVFVVLLALVFSSAINTISCQYTRAYAEELRPLAERIGDALLRSPGSPPEWYMNPSLARGAAFIGLSDGRPCILSTDKVYALSFFNDSELCRRLALDDSENYYGVRIEISSNDGAISVASGYIVDDGTMDVCKSIRLVSLRDEEGDERDGRLIVYLWRKYAGSTAADGR